MRGGWDSKAQLLSNAGNIYPSAGALRMRYDALQIIFNVGTMGGVEFSNPNFFVVPLYKVTKNFRTHTNFF